VHIVGKELGAVIKNARLGKQFTQEQLAEKIGVGPRHVMAIENEGKRPSYEVLYNLIHVLDITADFIFRPKAVTQTIEQEQFIREFLSCGEREQKIVSETVRVLLREIRNGITD
jgi:transcriptional regulator with XRE-family HTH domain